MHLALLGFYPAIPKIRGLVGNRNSAPSLYWCYLHAWSWICAHVACWSLYKCPCLPGMVFLFFCHLHIPAHGACTHSALSFQEPALPSLPSNLSPSGTLLYCLPPIPKTFSLHEPLYCAAEMHHAAVRWLSGFACLLAGAIGEIQQI